MSEPESEPESEQDSDYEDPYMTSLNRDYAVKLILLVLKNEFTENSTFLKCVAPDYVPDKHIEGARKKAIRIVNSIIDILQK